VFSSLSKKGGFERTSHAKKRKGEPKKKEKEKSVQNERKKAIKKNFVKKKHRVAQISCQASENCCLGLEKLSVITGHGQKKDRPSRGFKRARPLHLLKPAGCTSEEISH